MLLSRLIKVQRFKGLCPFRMFEKNTLEVFIYFSGSEIAGRYKRICSLRRFAYFLKVRRVWAASPKSPAFAGFVALKAFLFKRF